MHLKAIFTLAPRGLDRGDTKEVPCTWLYTGVASQALPVPVRKVLVPEIQLERQINAYLHPTPYITFQEQTLEKYIKQGKVTEAPVSEDVLEKQETMIRNAIVPNKESNTMPKSKTPAIPSAQEQDHIVKKLIADNERVNAIEKKALAQLDATPTPSALDAILAQPIVPAPITIAPKRALALPEERSEQAIVQGMAPGFALHADMYKAFVQAFKQALKEEGLIIVKANALQHGGDETSAPEPVPYDPMADCLAAIEEAAAQAQAPAKPKSTLQIFTGGKTTPKSAAKGQAKASGGKTNPAIIKAIQQAWNSGKTTQSALAEKYNMDAKKIWYFCSSRCKQYV